AADRGQEALPPQRRGHADHPGADEGRRRSPGRAGVRGLSGKVVVVTGAGRGMGAAMAERLAAEGARVGVTDIDGESALAAAKALEGAAGFRLDITDAAEVSARVAEITAALGPIDALVNNAGWDKL